MNAPSNVDLVVVGAGPAGMAAAVRAVAGGLTVAVLDSQAQPGGQIWRNALGNAEKPIVDVLGAEYRRGIRQVQAFLTCGADYIPEAQVSRLSEGWVAEYVKDGAIRAVRGRHLLLATGAQERPVPFPGWTLPGVMTVGAAQILLKTAGQVPQGPVLIAGSGPLPLLYLHQLRMAGSPATAYIDTTPGGFMGRAIAKSLGALKNPGQVLKGIGWLPTFSGVTRVKQAVGIAAKGSQKLEAVEVQRANGEHLLLEAKTLLIHEGLVPNHELAVSAGARLAWDTEQQAFRLERDEWMNAGPEGLYLAGDGARIGGASNAEVEGQIAAIGVLLHAGLLERKQAEADAARLRTQHSRQRSFRTFLDSAYPPNISLAEQDAATILCRCEELTAGVLRDAALHGGCRGPNQLKTFTRAGMGPCQGRQCGYPVHELVKSVATLSADEVGLYYPRPPFAPLTVSMLAAADGSEPDQ